MCCGVELPQPRSVFQRVPGAVDGLVLVALAVRLPSGTRRAASTPPQRGEKRPGTVTLTLDAGAAVEVARATSVDLGRWLRCSNCEGAFLSKSTKSPSADATCCEACAVMPPKKRAMLAKERDAAADRAAAVMALASPKPMMTFSGRHPGGDGVSWRPGASSPKVGLSAAAEHAAARASRHWQDVERPDSDEDEFALKEGFVVPGVPPYPMDLAERIESWSEGLIAEMDTRMMGTVSGKNIPPPPH